MDERETKPLGVVLAGGRGSRLGGAKATAQLAGRPLISYPLTALAAAGLETVVVAKPNTALGGRPLARPQDRGRPKARPAGQRSTTREEAGQRSTTREEAGQRTTAVAGLGAVEVLAEPEEPVHPLAGIVAALRLTRRALVVVGCDFPFVPAPLLRLLAEATEPLVVPAPGGELQPLVARWTPGLLPALEEALAGEEPLRRTAATLSPRLLDDELAAFGDPARAFFNVNTPADLDAAAKLVDRPR